MNAKHPTNAQVLSAFESWKDLLISSGFSQSESVYYLRGEYELGPAVVKSAADLVLLRKDLTARTRFWQLAFEFTPQELVWNVDGTNWRLLHSGPSVGRKAFFGNAEAFNWFTSAVAEEGLVQS